MPGKRQPTGQKSNANLMKNNLSTGARKPKFTTFPLFLSFSRGLRTRDEKVRNSILGHTKVLWEVLPRFFHERSGSTTSLSDPHAGSTTIYTRLDRNIGANIRPQCFSHYPQQLHIATTLRFVSRFCASVPGAERDAVKLSQSLSDTPAKPAHLH